MQQKRNKCAFSAEKFWKFKVFIVTLHLDLDKITILLIYMRYYKMIAAALIGSSTLTSCFKDEPLNAECDIEQAYIHVDNPTDIFYQASDTLADINLDYSDSQIIFKYAKRNASSLLKTLAPQFRITEGATITPASGTIQDFSNGPVTYTVTSQDRNWSRLYQVSIQFPPVTYEKMEYEFENYFLSKKPANKYYEWSDKNDDGTLQNNWATGNPGFYKSDRFAKADTYPTTPEPNGYKGACVKLTTRDTGAFGMTGGVKMPIAAGNLFTGSFDSGPALTEPMQCTKFGLPVSYKPVKLEAWYKYQRGETFTNKNKEVVEGKKDYGTIYAVLYERLFDNEGNEIPLHGDDIQTSPRIAGIALGENLDNTQNWTHLELNFEYKKDVDDDKLAAMGYNLAIVCSSSVDGAKFEGAIGSTLYVDSISITCEKSEEE